MKTKDLTLAALIGALYTGLTLVFGMTSFGPWQCRLSEALCVLPFFFPATAPGLFVGCLLSNLLGGLGPWDIVLGPLATLLACLLTVRCKNRVLATLPPVILNALVVPIIILVSAPETGWSLYPALTLQVGLGEAIACCGLGLPILYLLPRIPFFRRQLSEKALAKLPPLEVKTV